MANPTLSDSDFSGIVNDDLTYKLYVIKQLAQHTVILDELRTDLRGNGGAGVLQRVASLEGSRNKLYGIATGIALAASLAYHFLAVLTKRLIR